MSANKVTGEGNLVTVRTPKFLSVVGLPANKRAFGIVRSEPTQPTTGESHMKPQVVRRQRRSDPTPILRMVFPETYTDEQVTEKMTAFGLTGFDVQRSEGGTIVATRSDLKSISTDTTTEILLTADGIKATVQRTDSAAPANPKSGLAVVSLVFRADTFTPEAVASWLVSKGMSSDVPQDGAGDFIVQRREVPAEEETRVVELEPGVSAVVARADSDDIPDGYVAVVNETCYGNWGWGQLDFAASMADVEFSRVMDDAVYRLRHVLDQILLYSALPLAERKTLMVNALEQFKTFAVGILDSLPRTILVAVARSASPTKENPEMTTNTAGGATNPAKTETPAASITRADIQSVLQEMLPGLLADALKGTVARSEGGADGTPPTSGEPKKEEAAPVAITRADISAAVAEAVKPLVERVERVEGTTVLRSDTGDASVTKTETDPSKTGDAKDVFRGAPVFGGLGLKRAG